MKKYYHKFPFYVTILCIFIPVVQVLISYYLNRYILILTAGFFILSFRIPKVRVSILFIILTIFWFIAYGVMEQKGYSYSSSCAPLIYGIMFYFYFKARLIPFNEFYSSHVSKIYKILLLFMGIEFVIANFIVGYPGEKWDEILDTIRFAEHCSADYIKIFVHF